MYSNKPHHVFTCGNFPVSFISTKHNGGDVMKTRYFSALIAAAAIITAAVSGVYSLENAADMYKMRCSACHGNDGKANTTMGKNFGIMSYQAPEVQKMSDAQLADIITMGKNKMPAFKDKITAEQIKELVKYIRTLK
jgi:mono/diheme cytochrome c family protein